MNLTESAILAHAAQLQQGALSMGGDRPVPSLTNVVEQCATAFQSNEALSFLIMIRLVQLKSAISR